MKKFLLSFSLLSLALVGVGCGDDEEQPQDETEQVDVGPNLNVSEYATDDEEDSAKMDTDIGKKDDEDKDADDEGDSEDSDEDTEAEKDSEEQDDESEETGGTVSGDTLSTTDFDLTVPSSATIAQVAGSDQTEYFVTDCEDEDCFVTADAEDDDYTLYVVTGNEADLKDGERFSDIYKSTSADTVAGQSVTFGTDAQHPDGPGPNYAYYRADEKTGEFIWIEVSYVEGEGLEAAKETLENIDWK